MARQILAQCADRVGDEPAELCLAGEPRSDDERALALRA